jgi:carboxyl-terminal processing protease
VKARAAIAFGTALVFLFALGLWLGGHPGKLPGVVRDLFVSEPVGLTAEATEVIEDNYYREVGQKELGNASLQGLVRELRKRNDDRFSEYFSPEALEHFNEAISGRFSGIGLSVTEVKRGLRVDRVFHGSPAAAAGIEVGEVVVSVGGQSIAGVGSAEATAMIKGPEGTEVRIGVLDSKSGRVRQLNLTRAEVALPVVSSRVVEVGGHKLGYVRLLTFSEGAHALLERGVRKVQREGAEGILLDLRGNGGGLLQEAVLTASVFLPEDEVVVTTDSRTQGHAEYRTVGGNLPPLPIAVLIDGNTASAAEILTAALADDAGAAVVGTTSYGKGVFQQEIELENGGALKLTIGEYFTPDGTNLAGKGIKPDVSAPNDPATPGDEGKQRALRVLAGRVEG